MSNDLQSKLRRLGVVKGTRNLKPAPPAKRPSSPRATDQAITTLLPGGEIVETAVGGCFVLDHVYPLSHTHGDDRLGDLLALTPEPAATFDDNPYLHHQRFHDFLFLDTETTGLAGAGTVAFMVGVAFFETRESQRQDVDNAEKTVLVVRQYFLRDFDDEPAMLRLLEALAADKAGMITFNGRSFDLPLLDGRFALNRQPNPLAELPHIDLLPPSRRLWRQRLGSCALGALEPNLLGVHRTQEDVPGWMIPSLYHNYLLTGNAAELTRVFYHNRLDMLSMVTLAARIMRLFTQPNGDDPALDLVSLGKWQADLGLTDAAEQNLRRAVQGDLSLADFHQGLHRLGLLLKRNGRRQEAVTVWQQIATTCFDDVEAHVELAKYYEWHAKDLSQAIYWTQQAVKLVDSWRSSGRAKLVRAELAHRLQRLERKTDT